MIELLMTALFAVLAAVNALVLVFFVLPDRKYKKHCPPLSVIIPAHNEAPRIKSTVESVLNSDYKNKIDVMIVDDGSTDGTASVARKIRGVRVFSRKHAGKSAAINFGVSRARYETIVYLDADSSLRGDSLSLLVRPLADKKIGLSSGVILAKQTKNPLSWVQGLDYIVYSGWRYACSRVNAICVAPGFAAFRKKDITKAGGFSSDTLTEDIDTTLIMRKAGHGVAMTSAVMLTSVPSTLSSFFRQRVRWGRGTIQTAKKHRDILLNTKMKSVGFYGFPMHLFWYPFALVYLPLSIYWIAVSYSGGVFFFVKWLTFYGIIDLFYNLFIGTYAVTPIIASIIVSWILSFIFLLLAIRKFSRFSWKALSYIIIFPYTWIVFAAQGFAMLRELFSNDRGNVWTK